MLGRFSLRKRRPLIKTFNVVLLDGANVTLNLDTRSQGKELLDRVLQESGVSTDKAFFSLAVQEEDYLKWIILHKPLKKQLPGRSPYTVLFRVHIYPHNHHSMVQSLTRHFLYLQIKQDLQMSRLQPASNTMTNRIAALVVQGELGNYIPHMCTNGYIKELQVLPNITSGVEEAVKQAHRLNRGRLPGDCEEEVLDLVQDEPTYGSYFYNVQDNYRQPVRMCVCPVGVRVSQNGRQIACFKWELIVRVYHKGKHIYLNMDTAQALPVYEAHYVCRNSAMAQNISSWCQTLLTFYCSAVLHDNSKSRLKRFFSSRRSLRRRPNQIQTQFSGVNIGRNRRASLGEDLSSRKTDSNLESPSRLSFIKRQPKRTESKMVIYGLSGLASPPDEQTPSRNSTHSVVSPTNMSESQFSMLDNRSSHEDSTLENIDKDCSSRLSRNSNVSLHAIQEFSGSGYRTDSVEHGSRKMDEVAALESGLGSDMHINSDRYSGSGGVCSPPDSHRGTLSRRSGYGQGGGASKHESDDNIWSRRNGRLEESELEHKSISSMMHDKKQQPHRFMPSGDPRDSPGPPPPLPPRTFSEADTSLGNEDEFQLDSDSGARDSLPLPPLPNSSSSVRGTNGRDLRIRHVTSLQNFTHSRVHHPSSSSSHHSSPSHQPHPHHPRQSSRHHSQSGSVLDSPNYPISPPHPQPTGPSSRVYNQPPPGRKQHPVGGGVASKQRHPHGNHQYSLSQPSTPSYGHAHSSTHQGSSHYSHHHRQHAHSPTYSSHTHRSSSPRQHYPSPSSSSASHRNSSNYITRGVGERESQRSHGYHHRQWRDSHMTTSSAGDSSSPVPSAHDQSYDADQSQDGSSLYRMSGRMSSESNNTEAIRSNLRHSHRMVRRYSYDASSRDAVISPSNGRGLTGPESFRHGYSEGSSHHYQAVRKGQTRNNGAWQEEVELEEEEFVPPTTTSLPLHSNPDYSLYEEDEEREGVEIKSYRRSSSSGRPRAGSVNETTSVHEGGWHVPRHKRLRHSTITSLTSLHSDVTGGLSRLGSIASLDHHQANLAELSQTDSIGYFDPHVRSLIFEASHSQGTEL